MATVSGSGTVSARGVYRYQWSGLSNGDAGTPVRVGNAPQRSVQVTGTFGTGGTVVIEGSNDGGSNWHTLTDPQGNDLSFDAAGLAAIQESTQSIRPNVTAGDSGTDLSVSLVALSTD